MEKRIAAIEQSFRVYLKVNGKQMSQLLKRGENKAIFTLHAGKAKLNVWAQEKGKPYIARSEEDTIRDLNIRRLMNN